MRASASSQVSLGMNTVHDLSLNATGGGWTHLNSSKCYTHTLTLTLVSGTCCLTEAIFPESRAGK